MKAKFTLTLSFLLAALTAFGQNGLKEGNYFLLLNNTKTISLNTYENDKIKEIKTFAITEKSIFTTDQKTRVAILDTAKNIVYLYNIQTSKRSVQPVPFDIKPKTLLLNDDNLFIGGEIGKEMLIQYHIQTDKWFPLEIPTQVLYPRKAVDDLLINDSLLIAIDNIVMPKYILFYRLNSNGMLTFSHFKEPEPNGAYEHIYKGRITPKYLGTYSSTFSGYIGHSQHISIYNNLDLTSNFIFSTNEREEDFQTFTDFLIIGDKLFIASKEKGFGTFEIKDSCFKVRKDRFYYHNVEVSTAEISYKEYKNENIIRLTIIPNHTKIILTIRNKKGKIRHEAVEV